VILFLFLVIHSIVSCKQQDLEELHERSKTNGDAREDSVEKRSDSSRLDSSFLDEVASLDKSPTPIKRLTRRIAYGLLFANPAPQASMIPNMSNMYGMQY
jgi:hypothetical protein